MQEYWEIYMKNLEGKPASILFNAGISMDITDMELSYPHIAFVKVKLKETNDKGLLSKNEEAEILFLEDKLEASLIKFRIGKYVGRIISDGYVTFLYYLQFTYNWQDFLDFALIEHQSYDMTSGTEEDPPDFAPKSTTPPCLPRFAEKSRHYKSQLTQDIRS
jgi:hypothetical protein